MTVKCICDMIEIKEADKNDKEGRNNCYCKNREKTGENYCYAPINHRGIWEIAH